MRLFFELMIAGLLILSSVGHMETAHRYNELKRMEKRCQGDLNFTVKRVTFLERLVVEGWEKANGLEAK
jgi:hypothetical protein